MAGKSLLEIETARRRLEQLDGDRQELSTLIQKLKQIRDTMTSLAATTEANERETEKWLKSIEGQAAETNEKARAAIESFSKALQSFDKKAKELLVRTSQLPDQVLAQMVDLERELRGEISAKANDLDAKFAAFRDKHFEGLDEVSKTYERMRISYDNIRNSIRTLEDLSENLRSEFDTHVQDTSKSLTNLEGLITEQDLYTESLQRGVDLAHEAVDSTMADVKQLIDDTDRRFEEVQKSLTELAQTFQEVAGSYEKRFRVLQLGIVLALLLSFIAVLVLVFR